MTASRTPAHRRDTAKRILFVHYSNPCGHSPLEHSTRLLAESGWEILFLCTGAFGADALRFPEHPRIKMLRMPYQAPGWRQKVHYIRFIIWTLVWAIRWRPAWAYASDVLACVPALLLSYLPGIRVVYHEHDSPAEEHPTSAFAKICLRARRSLAARVRLNVLPNEQRAERFQRDLRPKGDVLTVWNCPRRFEAMSGRSSPTGDSFNVVYQGSVVPVRLPPTILEALTLVPDRVHLQVVGYETIGHPGYADQLRAVARRLGIDHRIEFRGTVPLRADMLVRCRRGDVGLSLMPLTEERETREMIGASIKAFDYLACGVPLLVSDHPAWRRFYVEPGFARACDPQDPASIAEALTWFLEHPAEAWQMGECARKRILGDWNYETQFAPVFRALNSRHGVQPTRGSWKGGR